MVRYPAERERRAARREGTSVERGERAGKRLGHSSTLSLVCGYFGWGEGQGRSGKEKMEDAGEERDGGEGPVWLLSASHVSKPVLKNE